jgi:hypothetical protein
MLQFLVFSNRQYVGRLAVSSFGHIYMNRRHDIVTGCNPLAIVKSIPNLRMQRINVNRNQSRLPL